ncbi:hypothetical protein HDU97_002727 [Phlyctochytrium planicorne]|nr:hypothetical protein HDU97_002727 [Phlyctochytrium planicorne]
MGELHEKARGVELVKTFVPRYVRALTFPDGEKWKNAFERMVEKTEAFQTFVEMEEMVVAMIDISGYSKVASALAILGKYSSELISINVGRYIKQLMRVVDDCSGDVIKFLGDAILVTFTRLDGEDSELVALRAAACCSRCLLEHQFYQIKMDEVFRRNSVTQGDEELPDFKLSLHIGILLGEFQHVVVGDRGKRLEYCINGESLSDLSLLLDSTVAGEMAMNQAFVTAVTKFVEWPDEVVGDENPSGSAILNVVRHRYSFNSIRFNFKKFHRGGETVKTASHLMPEYDEYDSVAVTPRHSIVGGSQTTLMSRPSVTRNESLSRDGDQLRLVSIYEGLPDPLCRFVNTSLLSRLATIGSSSFKPDYRRISVLFAKLKGKFHPVRSQAIVVAFMEAVSLFDDKGQNILAFFGLPPFAHENSALFAAKAAVKFASHFTDNKTLLPSISVGTGDCLNELIGTAGRKEIFVMGDFINVAARLLGVQSNLTHIMLDNDTKELICRDFQCLDVGSIKVKGKDRPIQVWGLLGAESNFRRESIQDAPTTRYFGYENETARLVDGYHTWRRNREGFWSVVQGESGTGKSSLMAKVSKEISNQGTHILTARGSEVEQWTPYFGLQPVLCYILKVAGFSGSSAPRNVRSGSISLQIRRSGSIASESSRLTNLGRGKDYSVQEFEYLLSECGENPLYAPLLAQTLPWLKFQCVESVEKLSMPAKNRIISSILLKLLSSYLAKGDCILVLDDAQWLDSVSVGIYEQLAQTQGAHCCLIFSRPITGEVENGLDKIVGVPNVANIQIYGLGRKESAMFLSQILRVPQIPEDIVNIILRKTNGNIIQTQMIAESIYAQRDLIFDEPSNYIGIKDQSLFESIVFGSSASIISSQLDRLTPEFQKLLKCASILGQYFSLEDVEYILIPDGVTTQDLIALIQNHDQFNYLSMEYSDISPENTSCNFKHVRIMYAIYESISVAERTALHQLVAELYEDVAAQDPSSRRQLLPSLHHHYSKTSNVGKMVAFGEECGDVQFDAGMFREASVYFGKCIEYWKKLGKGSLSPYQDGRILSKFAYCLAFPLTSLERGVLAGVEALALAGESWADDDKGIAAIFKADLKRFVGIWMRSKQGRRQINFTTKREKILFRDWYPNIRFAFFALNTAALCDPSMKGDMKVMILLKSLIFALTEADTNTDEVFSILYCFVYGMLNNPSKPSIWLARYFSKRAKRLLPKCGRDIADKFFLYGCAETYIDDNPGRTVEVFDDILKFATETRKLTHLVRSFAWVWSARLCKGMLKIPTVYNHPWLNDLVREDPVWICISMYGPMTCAFIAGNYELFSEYLNFHRTVMKMIPEKSLAMVEIHSSLFELMGQMMLSSPEAIIIDSLGRAFKECNAFLAREPDISFAYSFVFCLLSVPNRMTTRMKEAMREGVASKIGMYRANSVQGHFSNFNYFMIQAAGFQLGICKPPAKFARFLKSRQPEWKEGGNFEFLLVLGHAILTVHLPLLMPKSVIVADIATRLRSYGAVLLESWVRGLSVFALA